VRVLWREALMAPHSAMIERRINSAVMAASRRVAAN
jgi:hypothetical protein